METEEGESLSMWNRSIKNKKKLKDTIWDAHIPSQGAADPCSVKAHMRSQWRIAQGRGHRRAAFSPWLSELRPAQLWLQRKSEQ